MSPGLSLMESMRLTEVHDLPLPNPNPASFLCIVPLLHPSPLSVFVSSFSLYLSVSLSLARALSLFLALSHTLYVFPCLLRVPEQGGGSEVRQHP